MECPHPVLPRLFVADRNTCFGTVGTSLVSVTSDFCGWGALLGQPDGALPPGSCNWSKIEVVAKVESFKVATARKYRFN